MTYDNIIKVRAASVMDSTQDSGSWNEGSTPPWRITQASSKC